MSDTEHMSDTEPVSDTEQPRLFLATQIRGAEWDPSKGRREQKGWDEHAAFMERLVAEGRIVLGGPVGDGTDALLVVDAPDDDSVYLMLGDDPWYGTILETAIVIPWEIWVDGRSRTRSPS